ncbi:hypothetical protein [Klenkia brasiliensis]|uniref:ABC-2 family transporter protein n=1 Tax=Klenkia brasiliensis TaxID=333142 RepID=A0A1G7LY24_9ACTN|nr:hypothetical protein [Klenkia brasiliensis]SDF54407.1 hypothetical protein SAMN05660324_0434 [Klenkia brasiliensis]
MGGLSGPPPPAEPGAETARSDGHTGRALARGILLPALIATLNGVVFVAVYLGALHDPVPHDLAVGVVGSAQQVTAVQQALDSAQPGGFAVRGLPDAGAADAAVRSDDVYGALVLGGGAPQLLTAGAHGQGVTQTLTEALTPVAQQLTGTAPATQDLVPLVAGDTRGLSVFYAAFGVVLGGFLFGIATFQAAPQLLLRWRVVSIALFAVVAGALVALLADVVYAAVPAGPLVVGGVVALLAAACGATAALAFRLFGSAGQVVTSIGLVILGNATSTGNAPAEFLPGWMRPLADVLPSGVAVQALRGAAYFSDADLVRGLVVLGLWAVLPLLAIAGADLVARRRAD